MLTLKCTKNVQDYLSLMSSELMNHELLDSTLLGAWYVNLIEIERKKHFLFVNERTLISFVCGGFKKSKNLKHDMHNLFISQLLTFFKELDFSLKSLDALMAEYENITFSKTTSRSILGSMNDLAQLYRHYVWFDGGLNSCDMNEIILRVNNTPQANLGHKYSIDTAKAMLLRIA